MKAMIFAAGLGTRLRPLTNTRPKALLEINGITLLERAIRHVQSAGVSEIIVNTHHFTEQIAEFLRAKNDFGLRVEISFEEILLDTGGGLKKAAWFFDDDKPFIVHNADVISELDLLHMYRFHIAHKALATLAVKPRSTKRYLLFDKENRLCGREEASRTESSMSAQTTRLAFDGIHVISPALFDMMYEEGAFSIFATYLRLAAAGERILAFRSDDYYWRDVGKIEELEHIIAELASREKFREQP